MADDGEKAWGSDVRMLRLAANVFLVLSLLGASLATAMGLAAGVVPLLLAGVSALVSSVLIWAGARAVASNLEVLVEVLRELRRR